MKTLITYSSKTGNTKKVAEAIKKGINNSEILDISDVENLNYDVLIIGGWIDKGTFDVKTLNFAKTIKGKKIAFFFTLGAYPDSQHANDCIQNITNLFVQNGNEVLGNFHCQGAIDPRLIEVMKSFGENHSHAPTPERVKRWEVASKHPDDNDLQNASNYFKELLATRG